MLEGEFPTRGKTTLNDLCGVSGPEMLSLTLTPGIPFRDELPMALF